MQITTQSHPQLLHLTSERLVQGPTAQGHDRALTRHEPLAATTVKRGASAMRGVAVVLRGGAAPGNGVLSAAVSGAGGAVVCTECSRTSPDGHEQVAPGHVGIRVPGRIGTGGRGMRSRRTALARGQWCPTRNRHGRPHLLLLLPR